MSLSGKLEAEVEINSTGDVFYEMVSKNPNDISKVDPNFIQSCSLEEGEFGLPGSIISWNYTDSEGNSCVAKEVIEVVDDDKRLLKTRVIEGDLTVFYQSLIISVQVVPKGDGVGTIHWTIEYEKVDESVPEPYKFLNAMVAITKQIEG